MGLFYVIFRWGIILQALAIVHFIRRRPDTFWIFIIIFGGGLGAIVYLLVEALPDLRNSPDLAVKAFPRHRRMRELEAAILDNPSAGNFEELADLNLEEGNYARARDLYNRAISSRTDSPDPFYRRAVCAIAMQDYAGALPDLERVIAKDPNYDYHRAQGLLAHVHAQLGHPEKADAIFRQVTTISTLSETQYNYAVFLAEIGRTEEARQWAEKILLKRRTTPSSLKPRERPWFSRAESLLKRLPA